jgi:hypothetical protein
LLPKVQYRTCFNDVCCYILRSHAILARAISPSCEYAQPQSLQLECHDFRPGLSDFPDYSFYRKSHRITQLQSIFRFELPTATAVIVNDIYNSYHSASLEAPAYINESCNGCRIIAWHDTRLIRCRSPFSKVRCCGPWKQKLACSPWFRASESRLLLRYAIFRWSSRFVVYLVHLVFLCIHVPPYRLEVELAGGDAYGIISTG